MSEDCSEEGFLTQPSPLKSFADTTDPLMDANDDASDAAALNNDHDMESDVASSSDTDEDMDVDIQTKRARNVIRNQELLVRLGLAHGVLLTAPTKRKRKRPKETTNKEVGTDVKRGMLLKKKPGVFDEFKDDADDTRRLEHLYACYPHRETQLRMLIGLLMRPSSTTTTYTSPHILCTGPSGTGKSSIIRDLLDLLKPKVAIRTAYVNCETFYEKRCNIVKEITRQLFKDEANKRASTNDVNVTANYEPDDEPAARRSHLTRNMATTNDNNDKQHYYLQQSHEQEDEETSDETAIIRSISALCGLDCSLRGLNDSSRAIVVLDHAEYCSIAPRLLALHTNITFVVLTTHALFQHATRVEESTIGNAVHPIRIFFHAYNKPQQVVDILHLRCKLVLGESAVQQFIYKSFVTTLVQSVWQTTNNVRDIIVLGRRLWPVYLQPLSNSDDNDMSEQQVLALLDRKILPIIRQELNGSLYCLPTTTQGHHELPILAKYLLLAIYLCHANRPDRDKHLFSIQKNGRRRKQQHEDDDEQQEVAFGGVIQSVRPRTFPLERILSVFVSVVSLNQQQQTDGEPIPLCTKGNAMFFEMLANMRETGVLREHPSRSASEPVRLSDPRFSTTITEDEARNIADTINFPLDKYLL